MRPAGTTAVPACPTAPFLGGLPPARFLRSGRRGRQGRRALQPGRSSHGGGLPGCNTLLEGTLLALFVAVPDEAASAAGRAAGRAGHGALGGGIEVGTGSESQYRGQEAG